MPVQTSRKRGPLNNITSGVGNYTGKNSNRNLKKSRTGQQANNKGSSRFRNYRDRSRSRSGTRSRSSNMNNNNNNNLSGHRPSKRLQTNNGPRAYNGLTVSKVPGHGNNNANNDELAGLFEQKMSMQMEEVKETPPPAAAPSKRNLFKPVSSKLNSNSSPRSRSV